MLAHLGTRALGLADHTSTLAGMAASDSSYLLGPLHIVVHLATVVLAPVLMIAASLDAAPTIARRRATRR